MISALSALSCSVSFVLKPLMTPLTTMSVATPNITLTTHTIAK